MTKFYQINAQSGDHMIYQLIKRMVIIDHHDNNQSINWLNHNRFTALLKHQLGWNLLIRTLENKDACTICKIFDILGSGVKIYDQICKSFSHAHICPCIHTHIYTHVYIGHAHVYTHTCTHTYTHVRAYTHMYTYMHRPCTCIYMHIHMYSHTNYMQTYLTCIWIHGYQVYKFQTGE